MELLIGVGVAFLVVCVVRVVRTAPDEAELYRTPLDPRERAMNVERVHTMRERGM